MIKKKSKAAAGKVRGRNAHGVRPRGVRNHTARKAHKRKKVPQYDIDTAEEGYVGDEEPSPRYYEF